MQAAMAKSTTLSSPNGPKYTPSDPVTAPSSPQQQQQRPNKRISIEKVIENCSKRAKRPSVATEAPVPVLVQKSVPCSVEDTKFFWAMQELSQQPPNGFVNARAFADIIGVSAPYLKACVVDTPSLTNDVDYYRAGADFFVKCSVMRSVVFRVCLSGGNTFSMGKKLVRYLIFTESLIPVTPPSPRRAKMCNKLFVDKNASTAQSTAPTTPINSALSIRNKIAQVQRVDMLGTLFNYTAMFSPANRTPSNLPKNKNVILGVYLRNDNTKFHYMVDEDLNVHYFLNGGHYTSRRLDETEMSRLSQESKSMFICKDASVYSNYFLLSGTFTPGTTRGAKENPLVVDGPNASSK
jgi:hypothetical protein